MATEKNGDSVHVAEGKKEGQSSKSQRLLRVDQIYSRKDRQTHFVKTAKAKSRPGRPGKKNVLVVRRIISSKGMVAETEVDIKSDLLTSLMQEIFKGVEGLGLNKVPPVADPKLFFHAYEALIARKEREQKEEIPSQELIDDISTAIQFVEEDFGSRMMDLSSLLQNSEITFDLLWALFPWKELIYAPRYGQNGILGESQAFHLANTSYERRQNGSMFFSVTGDILSHDGEDFGRGKLSFAIDEYEGARKITNLNVFPFKFLPDAEKTRNELIERGKKYISIVKNPICKEYSFPSAVKVHYQPNGQEKLVKVAVQKRVMLDPEAFKFYADMDSFNEPWIYPDCAINRFDQLTDEDYLTCASWVNGFCFSTKEWARFMVSKLSEVTWNDEAFGKLAIAEQRRRIIHGLVRAHHNDESSFDDFVQNKGRGMVGLLSGSPGVGKTLTAEVVAEVTHRPLYMASGGELGMEPDMVDKRLQTILEITRRWSAVLLIDEADVFLTCRGKSIAQDTLVSIFLRRIEYFEGVLIMTTNRREEIDPAFESRIHFRLHYPALDEVKRLHIWNIFLAPKRDLLAVTDAEMGQLAKRQLNGRQIKNITSCAISLAKDAGKQLNISDMLELMDVIVGSEEDFNKPPS